MKIKTFEGSNIYEILQQVEREVGNDYTVIAIDKYISWKFFIPFKKVKITIGIKENKGENEKSSEDFKNVIINQLKIKKKEFQEKKLEADIINDNINYHLGESITEKIEFIKSINSHFEKNITKNNMIFFGTTGSGKSSIIGKLFLNEKNNFKNIALITADTYKVGSFEQLKSFCKLVDLPFQIAYSSDELESILSLMSDFDIVAVDTFSISPEVFDLINPYFEIPDSFNVFVLDLSKDIGYVKSIYSKYEKYIDGLAISKLDEATKENILKYKTIMQEKPIYIISYSQDLTKGYERLWQ